MIVADDASPQPFTADAALATIVRRSVNGGFGSAVNSGAAAATGMYLLILNSDLEIGPDFVSSLVAAAAPWQPCVAGPRMIEPDRINPSARHFPTVSHQVVEWLTPLARFRDRRLLHEGVGHDMAAVESDVPVSTDWLVGAVLLIPRAEFEAVGGLDERFHMNSEEVDLQRRLHDRGVPSIYLPGVVVRHEGGGSSDPGRRRRWLVDSQMAYADKWGSALPLRAALTAATGANLLFNSGRRLTGRPLHPLATASEELALIWKKAAA